MGNAGNLFAQKSIRIQSPDHQIVFSFRLTNIAPVYEVEYKGKRLVNTSTLELVFSEEGNFSSGLVAGKPVFRTGDETYELVVGKSKKVHSQK
jgi:alpha-glucosidase